VPVPSVGRRPRAGMQQVGCNRFLTAPISLHILKSSDNKTLRNIRPFYFLSRSYHPTGLTPPRPDPGFSPSPWPPLPIPFGDASQGEGHSIAVNSYSGGVRESKRSTFSDTGSQHRSKGVCRKELPPLTPGPLSLGVRREGRRRFLAFSKPARLVFACRFCYDDNHTL